MKEKLVHIGLKIKGNKAVAKFLKETEDLDKLVIDIRGNKGGQDQYWKNIVKLLIEKPLEAEYYSLFKDKHRHNSDPYKVQGARVIRDLDKSIFNKLEPSIQSDYSFYKKHPIKIEPLDFEESSFDKINFDGQIYLLVDNQVFAQAENFASFSKDTGFAKLVGEKTGGNRIFEEVPIFDLKSTRFAISYSRELGINNDGSINMETKTKPDIQIDGEVSKIKCIDAVLDD